MICIVIVYIKQWLKGIVGIIQHEHGYNMDAVMIIEFNVIYISFHATYSELISIHCMQPC